MTYGTREAAGSRAIKATERSESSRDMSADLTMMGASWIEQVPWSPGSQAIGHPLGICPESECVVQ